MTIQLSALVRNARSAAIESTIGAAAKVLIYTGTQPAATTTAATGTLLATFSLASDWATQAAGVLTFSGTPISATAAGTGTAGYYRLCATDGTTCGSQGTVTATGGGGDLTVDNTSIASGQTVQITGWTITEGNA